MTFKPGDRVVFVSANGWAYRATVVKEFVDERGAERVELDYQLPAKNGGGIVRAAPVKLRVGTPEFD